MNNQSSLKPEGILAGLKFGPVIIGVIADWIFTVVFAIVTLPIFLSSDAWDLDDEQFDNALNAVLVEPSYLICMLVLGSLATILGAYIAAVRAKVVHLKHGLFVAIGSTLTFLLIPGDDTSALIPLWYDIASWGLIFPSGLLGGYIAKQRQAASSA